MRIMVKSSKNNSNHVRRSFKPSALMSSCAYIYVSCHKECLLHTTLCFQTHLNIINIIIDVKNKKLLLHSVIVTVKTVKKMKGDK